MLCSPGDLPPVMSFLSLVPLQKMLWFHDPPVMGFFPLQKILWSPDPHPPVLMSLYFPLVLTEEMQLDAAAAAAAAAAVASCWVLLIAAAAAACGE